MGSVAGKSGDTGPKVRRIYGIEESLDYFPDDPEALKAELARTRTRLMAAEAVIDQLGESDDPIEQRLSNLLTRTAEEIERLHSEARERVESVVAEAEALRDLAQQQNSRATDQARLHVEKQAQDLLKDVDALTTSAHTRAARIIEDAERHKTDTERYVDDLLAEAERLYKVVEERIGQADQDLGQARAKADEVMRNANVAARETVRNAEESARRVVENARVEAAGLRQAANEQAQRRLDQVVGERARDQGRDDSWSETPR